MRFLRLNTNISRDGQSYEVYIKTEDDLTNQEIILKSKTKSFQEFNPLKLDVSACFEIPESEYWQEYDSHFIYY